MTPSLLQFRKVGLINQFQSFCFDFVYNSQFDKNLIKMSKIEYLTSVGRSQVRILKSFYETGFNLWSQLNYELTTDC